jgi:hypothetical protein
MVSATRDLGTDKTPPALGLYVEVVEPSLLFVQNNYEYVTFVWIQQV